VRDENACCLIRPDIFVGLSRRTNQSGIDQLAAAFPKYKGIVSLYIKRTTSEFCL